MGNNVACWQSGHAVGSPLAAPSLDHFIDTARHPHKHLDPSSPSIATIANG
jgi:hypothetical protein